MFQSLASGRAALINASNPVRLSTERYVTAEQLAQLKVIRDAIVARRMEPDVARPVGVPQDLPDRVTIFADTFVLGPVTGEIREQVSVEDRQASLMAVRNAKQYADFVAFSMPLPPTPTAAHYATARRPHEAVVSLAHELVDNGMDVYVGRGNHVVQGIEIYKGRPIFYNLGDLAVHRADNATTGLTALVATASYQDGILQEVRLYPVDLGVDPRERPASKLGVADDAIARSGEPDSGGGAEGLRGLRYAHHDRERRGHHSCAAGRDGRHRSEHPRLRHGAARGWRWWPGRARRRQGRRLARDGADGFPADRSSLRATDGA